MSNTSPVKWLLRILAVAAALFLAYVVVQRTAVALRQMVHDEIRTALEHDSQSIKQQRYRLASQEAAAFVNRHLARAKAFPHKFALLEYSLQSVDPNLKGLYCEFGVGGGTTVNFIASKAPHVTVHGFDSFEGLPEDWRAGYEKGHFKMDGLPKVLDNVKLHKGWFHESLPVWVKDHPGPLAFAHLDADLYSSTKTVLDLLEDRIVKGTILHFDEFINYPGWQDGEYKAFTEFVARRGIKFEYIGYTESFGHGDDQQVSVRILEVGAPGK